MLKYGLYMFYYILHLFILLCVSMRACIPCYTVHVEVRGKLASVGSFLWF